MTIPKLDLDSRHINKEDTTAFYNRNMVIDKSGKAMKNEDGVLLVESLLYPIVGFIDLPTGFVVFSTDNTTSEIGIYDNGVYTKILVSIYLYFKKSCPIEGTYKYNSKRELITTWWDGIYTNSNKPKLLNLTTLPFPSGLTGALELVAPSEIVLADTFPDYSTPIIDISVATGGQIETGVYAFTISYEFSPIDVTNWTTPTRWIQIADIKDDVFPGPGVTGFNYATEAYILNNKAINLNFTDLDTNFNFFRLGVIKKLNGVVTFREVGSYSIDPLTGVAHIVYTGEDNLSTFALGDVITNNAIYDKVKTGTNNNERLTLGNVTVKEPLDFQKYANNITVSWTTSIVDKVAPNYYFEDSTYCFHNRCFRPDEVEAVYIYFTFTDGTVSEAFHIPGRRASTLTLPSAAVVAEDAAMPNTPGSGRGDDVSVDAKYFHIFDTASNDGLDAFGLQYGTMGFWENDNEVYPTGEDFEVWDVTGQIDTIEGERVRHHKFPDISTIHDGISTDVDRVLGIKFEDVYIPADIQDKIQYVNFAYAKKDITNSLVLGDSTLIDRDWDLGLATSQYYRYHDFDLLNSKPAINPSFLRRNYSIDVGTSVITFLPPTADDNDQVDVLDNTAYSYEASAAGEEQYLELSIPAPIIATEPYLDSGDYAVGGDRNVGTLHQFKLDLYVKFYEQILVPLGDNFELSLLPTIEFRPNSVGLRIHSGAAFVSNRPLWTRHGLGTDVDIHCVTHQYSNFQFRSLPATGAWSYIIGGTGEANDYDYNLYWSSLMEYKAPLPYNTYALHTETFPHRVARSIVEQDDGLSENWRTFLSIDYKEMDKRKGEIWKLLTVNRTLLIEQKYSTFKAKLRDTLKTDSITAYMGSGDIFDILPQELISTNEGYCGCQSQWASFSYPGGACIVDRQQGKIFLYNGESLDEISVKGLNQFFKDNLDNTYDFDNPFLLNGISGTYDDEWDRLIFSIRRYYLIDDTNYKGITYLPASSFAIDDICVVEGEYVIVEDDGLGANIYVTLNPNLLIDTSFTVSYSLSNKYWTAFHDYTSSCLFYNRNGVYSCFNGDLNNVDYKKIYKHNNRLTKGLYYTNVVPTSGYIDVVFNTKSGITKLLESTEWQTDVIYDSILKYNQTFTHIMVYNNTQCSDIIELNGEGEWFDAMSGRSIFETWYFNNFRDVVLNNLNRLFSIGEVTETLPNSTSTMKGYFMPLNDTNPDVVVTPSLKNVDKNSKEYFDLSNFISKFVVIRLIYDNRIVTGKQADIYVNDVSSEFTQSSI